MKDLFILIKGGIGALVLICGAIGYLIGPNGYTNFSLLDFILFLVGLGALASGSCALNQVQEVELDKNMPRTKNRPLPSGRMSLEYATGVAIALISLGMFTLSWMDPQVGFLGFLTVLLYNGFYTYIWKPKWAFGAVPGAIPGAMPVVLGYVASGGSLLSLECFYLFMIMFLWQMPHFWALALKFKDDYEAGKIPVLPSKVGNDRTILHIGIYVFAYLAVALGAPLFVNAHLFYVLMIIPFSAFILFEFFKFSLSDNPQWFRFFMFVNASLLVFLVAPLMDKWVMLSL